MTRIVTTHYRYRRPPRERKPVALDVPALVTKASKHEVAPKREPVGAAPPANDDRKSAIVTARRLRAAASLPPGLLPDTPEEHQRRGDAADTLWRDMVRQATGKA